MSVVVADLLAYNHGLPLAGRAWLLPIYRGLNHGLPYCGLAHYNAGVLSARLFFRRSYRLTRLSLHLLKAVIFAGVLFPIVSMRGAIA